MLLLLHPVFLKPHKYLPHWSSVYVLILWQHGLDSWQRQRIGKNVNLLTPISPNTQRVCSVCVGGNQTIPAGGSNTVVVSSKMKNRESSVIPQTLQHFCVVYSSYWLMPDRHQRGFTFLVNQPLTHTMDQFWCQELICHQSGLAFDSLLFWLMLYDSD